ncbi:Ribonuclease BN, tRNA processing enzyme [Prauserella aidingensis]|nr:Ribonuclease BN, tRNA processing enzyme [Prauserella aidingensis]
MRYKNRVYLVDLGMGAFQRLAASGLRDNSEPNGALNKVRGIFFTHLHSDHTVDWPTLYATGSVNVTDPGREPIEVFGPGRRDSATRVYPPSRPTPALVNPSDPYPGIAAMTGYLRQGFAQDFNDRIRDTDFAGPDVIFRAHDIDISDLWRVDPAGKPPHLDKPIEVWQDGEVTVTATLVDHHPTAPAFGFRFDTPDGAIVISGDTTVSENLIDLAQGADYLVHEVIDAQWVDEIVSALPPEAAEPVRTHLLEAHTTIEQVGRDVAEPAGVKNLVLSHLVPGNSPDKSWRRAQRGFSGRLIIGSDLMSIAVRPSP